MITIENADIMRLLGMGAAELDVPMRYTMFDEVSKYFSNYPNPRQRILQILSKATSKDGLEAAWRYVQLQNERKKIIESLDPEDFNEPISDELKSGALTLEKMKKVEEDMAHHERMQRDRIVRMDRKESQKEQEVLQKAVTLHSVIKNKFDAVREINQTLERYGN